MVYTRLNLYTDLYSKCIVVYDENRIHLSSDHWQNGEQHKDNELDDSEL